MTTSQIRFLVANLNFLILVETKRVERSPNDPKTPRFAKWLFLKISTLARMSIG